MADSTLWWIAAGALVIAELVSGTFYLLMLALGLAAGALAAHAGLGASGQIVTAAVIGVAAVIAWHLRRRQRAKTAPGAHANPDVNPDIGQIVQIEHWEPDGTARVRYRGASWMAIAAEPGDARLAGPHRITEVRGNQLLVAGANDSLPTRHPS